MARGTSTSTGTGRMSVFVTTSLGTHLCVAIPMNQEEEEEEEDTVTTAGSLKLWLAQEHLRAFPHHGPVIVTALQTSFQGALFTLSHSLPLPLLLPRSQIPPFHLLLTATLLPVPPPPHSHPNHSGTSPTSRTSTSTSPQKRRKKTNNKGKEASQLELEASSGSNNAPLLKECVIQDMVPPDRKKLLVLDIDGLLADISYAGYKDQQHAHFQISGKSVFRRPFCLDFLKFCFSHFHVGVWSSRVQRNLEKAVDHLFEAMRGNLLFCWGQSKCTPTAFKTLEKRPLFLKDLSKLWDKVEPGLPWEKGRFSPTNTLLLDYNPCKASLNPPWTAIFPFPYNKNHKDIALGPGGEIRVYLEKIAIAEDIPKYVEGHPFGLAAWRKHPRWKHYVAMRKSLSNIISSK